MNAKRWTKPPTMLIREERGEPDRFTFLYAATNSVHSLDWSHALARVELGFGNLLDIAAPLAKLEKVLPGITAQMSDWLKEVQNEAHK